MCAETVAAFRYWRQPVVLEAEIEHLQPAVEARVSQQWHLGDPLLQVQAEFSLEASRSAVAELELQWPKNLTLDRVAPAALVDSTHLDSTRSVLLVRLARRRTLVQELPAIEVLARVDVLCLDKTGTITEGSMEVAGVQAVGTDGAKVDAALAAIAASDPDPNATQRALGERRSEK